MSTTQAYRSIRTRYTNLFTLAYAREIGIFRRNRLLRRLGEREARLLSQLTGKRQIAFAS